MLLTYKKGVLYLKSSLKNQYVVITGASGGLGEHLAYEVAKRGGIPVLLARTEEKLHRVAEQISQKYGITSYIYKADVANVEEVKRVVQKMMSEIKRVDVLINNAGFGVFEEVKEASIKTIASMFQVNVIGLIACTQEILAYMLKENKGHIINIASQAGKLATPKSSGYSASKHAVLGFTNSLRMELAKAHIYVTAVNPGPIQTNFFSIADQSGNYEKSVEKFMLTPQYVAQKTVNIIGKPKREVNLPKWMNIGSKMYQLAPGLVEKLAGDAFNRK